MSKMSKYRINKVIVNIYLVKVLVAYALVIILAVIIGSITNSAEAVEVKAIDYEQNQFDSTMEYVNLNPDFDYVTVSSHHLFISDTKLLACQYTPEGYLLLVDSFYYGYWIDETWQEHDYYHFWINEAPKRNFEYLTDNRNEYIDKCVANSDENNALDT